MLHKKLEITLLSDLCVGSGYAYAGIVDEDVCYDEYGIPFIPARRIKGCLKEAAEEIGVLVSKEVRDQLFGKSKDDSVKGIVIDNARITGYEEIKNEIIELKAFKDIAGSLTQQKILEEFSDVRGQTAMTDGVADENTLRYIRTVNQYSLFDQEHPLVFCADLLFDESFETEMEYIVNAFRHIGYNRNRGLGNIECRLIDAEEDKPVSTWKGGNALSFELVNEEPLMISAANNVDSLDYIPGRSLIGALASLYLKEPGKTGDSDEFNDLFLNGKVSYSNIYLHKDGTRCIPVPDFINRMKKTGKYVNTLQYNPDQKYSDDYSPLNGNQPKKLRGKYLSVNSKGEIKAEDVSSEIIYHHRRNVKKEEVLLYAQTAVSSGQTFSGLIEGDEKYLRILHDLLLKNSLRFGKSKTAQYGKCLVKNITDSDSNQEIECKEGDVLLVSAASDLVFMNETDYTVNFREVYEEAAKELGIYDCIEMPDEFMRLSEKDGLTPYSMLNVTNLWGYNSKWNLRRSPVPAIAAGSTFAFRMIKNCKVKAERIGEFTHEGNGEIRLFKMADMPYELQMAEGTSSEKDLKGLKGVNLSAETKTLVTECLMKTLLEKIMSAIQSEDGRELQLNATKIGRLTLMLKESLAYSDTADEQYLNMLKRVGSIKSEDDSKTSKALLKKYIGDNSAVQIKKILNINGSDLENSAEYQALVDLNGQDAIDRRIKAVWGEILMGYLTVQKYGKKA